MTEPGGANRWDRAIGLACVVAIVVFIVVSAVRIEQKINSLKGDLVSNDNTISDMRNQLETLSTRLQIQQAEEIGRLCTEGRGRFDANQSTCTFDDGRPALKFTALARGQ